MAFELPASASNMPFIYKLEALLTDSALPEQLSCYCSTLANSLHVYLSHIGRGSRPTAGSRARKNGAD